MSACQSYVRSVDLSPDGRFCTVLRSYPMLIAMPGHGSDAPGEVNLYNSDGRKLESVSLEMVQQFGGVTWSASQVQVDVGLSVKTWQLPQDNSAQANPTQDNSGESSNACLRFEQEKNAR